MSSPIDLVLVSAGLLTLIAGSLALGRHHQGRGTRGRGWRLRHPRWARGAPRSALPHYLPELHVGPLF